MASLLAMTASLLIAFCAPLGAKDYWEGNQLNNQARLGQPFDGFEVADPARKVDKPLDSYAAQVHGNRVQKSGSQNSLGMLVDLSGEGVGQFLTVSRLEDGGKRFSLRLNVLFNENTAEFRPGSVTLLERLDVLLKSAAKDPIQLEFIDDAGNFPGVQELHIQRVCVVTAYLAMTDAQQRD
jgi:hypothetical protein